MVLDECYADVMCPTCKIVTEHHVELTDELNGGEFIAYYAQCDICECITDYSVEEFEALYKE